MFTEKTKLASIEAIVKAPNYETIMNALQDVDDKVTPWVSMRIGVDTGMLSFETMTQQQYALKNYGWTYDLIKDVHYRVFKHLILHENNAILGLNPDFQGVSKVRRFSFFVYNHKNITCTFNYTPTRNAPGFSGLDVIASCVWSIPADPATGAEEEAGIFYIIKR